MTVNRLSCVSVFGGHRHLWVSFTEKLGHREILRLIKGAVNNFS
jgi:hypothetical protein